MRVKEVEPLKRAVANETSMGAGEEKYCATRMTMIWYFPRSRCPFHYVLVHPTIHARVSFSWELDVRAFFFEYICPTNRR